LVCGSGRNDGSQSSLDRRELSHEAWR